MTSLDLIELEERVEELEAIARQVHPSGLTSPSIVTRALTILGYSAVLTTIAGIIYLVLVMIIAALIGN